MVHTGLFIKIETFSNLRLCTFHDKNLKKIDQNLHSEKCPEFNISFQAYASDWEHVNLEPQGSNVFKMKTFHNTYLQAIAGDDMNVTQSYDSSAAGCLWTVQKLDNSMTRNYFGAVTGIKNRIIKCEYL